MVMPSFFIAVQTASWKVLISDTDVVEPLVRPTVGAVNALLPTPDKPLNDGDGMMPLAPPGSFSPSVSRITTRCKPCVVASGRGRLGSDDTQPFEPDTWGDHADDTMRHPHNRPVGMIVEPFACILLIALVSVV